MRKSVALLATVSLIVCLGRTPAFGIQYQLSATEISSLKQATRSLRLRLSQTKRQIAAILSESASLKERLSISQITLTQQRVISRSLKEELRVQTQRSTERLRLLAESKQLLQESKAGLEESLRAHRKDLWKARLTWGGGGFVLGAIGALFLGLAR